MKFQRPNTPPAEMTSEELRNVVDSIRELAVDVVEYLSEVMAVFASRKERHPFMADRILRFWREINDQRLSAEAAIYLANAKLIKPILPLSHDEQIRIARGEPVAIAIMTETGEIRSDDTQIHRMDDATLKRAFGPDGIRTVHAQAELIRAEGKVQRVGMITVLRDQRALKIGNQTIQPEEIAKAMASLGWECRWVGGMAKVGQP